MYRYTYNENGKNIHCFVQKHSRIIDNCVGILFQKSINLGHMRGSHLKTRFFRSVYVSFLPHKNGEFLLKTYT